MYTVAESDRLNLCGLTQGPAVHRHRVDIVEMNHLGAEPFHVLAQVDQNGDRTHRPHDSTNAKGVCDGLAQTVALGDLKIGNRARAIAADLDHVDRVGSAFERARAIGRHFDGARSPKSLGDPPRNDFGCLETILIDVIQADLRVDELGKGEGVSNKILCENGASSSDECDFPW